MNRCRLDLSTVQELSMGSTRKTGLSASCGRHLRTNCGPSHPCLRHSDEFETLPNAERPLRGRRRSLGIWSQDLIRKPHVRFFPKSTHDGDGRNTTVQYSGMFQEFGGSHSCRLGMDTVVVEEPIPPNWFQADEDSMTHA